MLPVFDVYFLIGIGPKSIAKLDGGDYSRTNIRLPAIRLRPTGDCMLAEQHPPLMSVHV